MKVCILTYDIEHRKTAEVFFGLHNSGKFELSFLTVPFKKRPERPVNFKHRPDQFVGVASRDIAAAFDIPYHDYEQRNEALAENDYLIVCGANILEANFANSGKIINGHAGLIPHVRGLDSFKWAILDDRVIGNTLHIIDEHADAGKVLHQVPTPIFRSDSLEDFAKRHYDTEIWLLTNFDKFLTSGTIFDLQQNDARMRMPMIVEEKMFAKFDTYKEKHALS